MQFSVLSNVSTQDLQRLKADRATAVSGRGGHIATAAKNLAATDSHWQRENQFSPMECHWVGPMARRGWPAQK